MSVFVLGRRQFLSIGGAPLLAGSRAVSRRFKSRDSRIALRRDLNNLAGDAKPIN